jgi:hypothetical protein
MTFGERGKEPEQKQKAENRKRKREGKGRGAGPSSGATRCVWVRAYACVPFWRPGGCRGNPRRHAGKKTHAQGAGQESSTAEASCQSRQQICASAFACRQVTGPPVFFLVRFALPVPPFPNRPSLSTLPLSPNPLSRELRAADGDPPPLTHVFKGLGILAQFVNPHVRKGETTVRTAWN